MKKRAAMISCGVLLLALLCAVFYMNFKETPVEDAGLSKNAPEVKRTLTYQGAEYTLKRQMKTILLMGTDSTQLYAETPEEELDFYSYHQADYLMLLVLDQATGKVQPISINRDTMTDVPWLDVFGDVGGTEYEQVCLAFNYGDGGAVSCKNTVSAVSGILFDLPIDAYIEMPMVSIPQLNDLVGGVTVTIPEDMTRVDAAFVAGETITLTGEQAEKFVRTRKAMPDDTNAARMHRQEIYMEAFLKQVESALSADQEFSVKALEELGNALQSDMTGTQLSMFLKELEKAEIGAIRTPEGELKTGPQYYEFYMDEASLWDIIRTACCE